MVEQRTLNSSVLVRLQVPQQEGVIQITPFLLPHQGVGMTL